jgi:hypothetical protein
MIVSLQRRLDDRSLDGTRERTFFSYSLQYLQTTSGRQIEVHDWMITSYEVEFGHEIGSGGLYVIYYSFYVFAHYPATRAAAKCLKGRGTRQMSLLKSLRLTVVSLQAQGYVRTTFL